MATRRKQQSERIAVSAEGVGNVEAHSVSTRTLIDSRGVRVAPDDLVAGYKVKADEVLNDLEARLRALAEAINERWQQDAQLAQVDDSRVTMTNADFNEALLKAQTLSGIASDRALSLYLGLPEAIVDEVCGEALYAALIHNKQPRTSLQSDGGSVRPAAMVRQVKRQNVSLADGPSDTAGLNLPRVRTPK